MSLDSVFWLSLAAKLIVTAGVVVTASMVAERLGALTGSLIATLPVSAGPAYVILSAEHDAAFLADSALMSFATNPAVLVFSVVYVLTASRRGVWLSLTLALAAWVAAAFAIQSFTWSIGSAAISNAVLFALAFWIVRRFRSAAMPTVMRRWYDVPLRVSLVVLLMSAIVFLSGLLGPAPTGALAVFPVVYTSLVLILHPRVGGSATAAVIANGISGLIGFAAALLVLHLTVIPYGAPVALVLALLTGIVWNLLVFGLRRSSVFGSPAVESKAV